MQYCGTVGFTLAALLNQSLTHPRRLPENRLITHNEYAHTCERAHTLCPLIFRLLFPSLRSAFPKSDGSISERRERLWSIFSRYSELSDQGAVCLQAHQILRRAETKSKHSEVPFKIHLRNGRAVCHCLHARVCVFVCLLTFFFLRYTPPFWATRFQQSWQSSILELIIIVSLLSHCIMDEPSKVQDSGFPSTVPPCFKWSFCS